MKFLDTGIIPLNGPSQYNFDPPGTFAQNWALIQAIDVYTFDNGTVSQSRTNRNFVFVTVVPPQFPILGTGQGPLPIRPYIGLDYPVNWVPRTPRYFPTNINTLVLGPDCKTVVTSHPGLPRGQDQP